MIDALSLRFREIAVQRDPACPVCGDVPTLTELIDYEAFCGLSSAAPAATGAEISPEELHARIASGSSPFLLDVREQWEFDLVHLPGAILLPLGELPERFAELPLDREMVAICHHGQRSGAARDFLEEHGFPQVRNLTGGLEAWARRVEPTMRTY